jgi:hypothetical protein
MLDETDSATAGILGTHPDYVIVDEAQGISEALERKVLVDEAQLEGLSTRELQALLYEELSKEVRGQAREALQDIEPMTKFDPRTVRVGKDRPVKRDKKRSKTARISRRNNRG